MTIPVRHHDVQVQGMLPFGPPMPRVTCQTIADHLHLSKETVTHILGGRAERFSPATVAKVEAAAKLMGYRKNSAAAATRTGRHNAIGLVGRKEIGRLHFEIQRWVIDACRQRDWHVLATELKVEDLADPERGPRIFRELAVDGLLVHYAQAIPKSLIELVSATRSPVVWVNTQHPIDAVYPDDAHAWSDAVERLHAVGHRHLGYIGSGQPRLHPAWLDREMGAVSSAAALNCSCRIYHLPDNWDKLGWERIQWFRSLIRKVEITAYLIPRSGDAAAFVAAAAAEGLVLPKDRSLVTISDGGGDDTQGIPLSHVRTPAREIALQALIMLGEKIETPGSRASSIVPFKSATLTTIAPPPSSH